MKKYIFLWIIGFFLTMLFLRENPVLYLLIHIIAVFIWFIIIVSPHNKNNKLTWLFILLINPILGMALYYSIGRNYTSKELFDDKVLSDSHLEVETVDYGSSDPTENILYRFGRRRIVKNNELMLFKNGSEKFEELKKDLWHSTAYIYLEYYIVSDGTLLDEIIEILIAKKKEGVKVKILVDNIGASDLSDENIQRLMDAFIDFDFFKKIGFNIFSSQLNYRNHRKIAVIDGKIGYFGGINIGDEYIYGTEKLGFWHDTHGKVMGDCVFDLELIFCKDWYYSTKEKLTPQKIKHEIKNDVMVQVLPSGADNKEIGLRDLYFSLICNSTKSIYITTPYFVPDDELLQSLITASKRGVDVNVIFPERNDIKFARYLMKAYYYQLLEAGIRIYETKDSFIHSKILVIDDYISTLGTVNFDFRSFFLNFENCSIILDRDFALSLKNHVQNYMLESREVLWSEWQEKSVFSLLGPSILKLLAPLF